MRIHTLLEFQITEHGLELIREEGYEYCGPLELCDRGQSAQVVKQGTEQSAQNASNAQTADTATNTAVGQYNQRLNDFMRFGRQTYGANGEFMRDANTLGTTTARAGSAGIGANLATNAMRTGDNTANYANVAAESQRSADRDLTTQLASADQQRLSQLTAINQYGVQASQFPAQVQAQLYGTSTSGEGSNLSPASSASMAPSGWQVFGQDLASGVGAAAGAFAKCWIAEVLYGVDDPRTHLLRAWLNYQYAHTLLGGVVMKLYGRFGYRIAQTLRKRTWLQRFFRPLFAYWLKWAEADRETFVLELAS